MTGLLCSFVVVSQVLLRRPEGFCAKNDEKLRGRRMTGDVISTSVSREHLHGFVARFVGKGSRGLRSLTYANSQELHGNSLLRQLADDDASPASLDAAVRDVVSQALHSLGPGVQALAGAHPDTIGQSHPKRRRIARELLNHKDQGYFNSEIEPHYIVSIVDALAPMVGVTSGGRQLQHEYEVLSRECDYSIDPDDHLLVEHWAKIRIRALGGQVRLFHGLYVRKMKGQPPKPDILSGHELLGPTRLESAEESRYSSASILVARWLSERSRRSSTATGLLIEHHATPSIGLGFITHIAAI
jgi:hypothetical protein